MVVRNVFVLSTAIGVGALVIGALAFRYGVELFALKNQIWEYHGRSRVILAQMATAAWKLQEKGPEPYPARRVQRLRRAIQRLERLRDVPHAPEAALSTSGLRRSLSKLEGALTGGAPGDLSRPTRPNRRNLRPYLDEVSGAIVALADRHGRAMRALESRYRNRLTEVVFNLTVAAIATTAIVLTVFVVVVCWIHRRTGDNRRTLAELRDTQKELEILAYHDPLTELPNRRLFQTHLRRIIGMASRSELRFALLLLDLDDFKQVNDSFGHQAGDLLLRAVAQRLQAGLRQVDLVARVGGDEFAVVLADTGNRRETGGIIDKLVDRVSQPLSLGEHCYRPRLSMGVFMIGPGEESPEQVMKCADLALYQAKDQGKGCYRFHTRELEIDAERKRAAEARLRRGLEQGALILHLQPQVHVGSRRIVGFEALLRCRDEEGRTMFPDDFLPGIKDPALLDDLVQWVTRNALVQVAALHRSGFKDVDIAVNVSPRQLYSPGLPEVLHSILTEVGVETFRLKLEIAEATLLDRVDESRAIIDSLRQLGIRVSVDDFGTGYSSLGYLKLLATDEIKIDRSCIVHIAEDPEIRELVKAIISLAHGLKMLVVAEGVETREQLEILEGLGCDVVQGFYCGVPMPFEQAHSGNHATWMGEAPIPTGDGRPPIDDCNRMNNP